MDPSNKNGNDKQKPQYYFLYGSIDEENGIPPAAAPASPAGGSNTDEGSLVGESLVPTDTEEERPLIVPEKDQSHMVLMSGNEIKSLLGGATAIPDERGFCNNVLYCLNSFKERHPIVHISLLGSTLAILLFVSSVILFPDSQMATAVSAPEADSRYKVPFPSIDRSDFNDPVSSFLNIELFDPQLLYQGRKGSRVFQFPFPTGAFWTNLVVKTPQGDEALSYPITVYPYGYKWSGNSLVISYPAAHRKIQPREIRDYFFPDLSFSVMEGNDQRHVRAFDPLSVSLRFYANTPRGTWDTCLVQGSPYVTLRYRNVSPVIHALSTFKDVFCPRDEEGVISFGEDDGSNGTNRRLGFGVCSQETSSDGYSITLRGVQFMIQTEENMLWFVFASEPVTLTFDLRTRTKVTSLLRFNGVLRFAIIPNTGVTGNSTGADSALKIASSTGLQRLIYHAGVYPVGASVSWSFRPAAASDATKMLLKSVTGIGRMSSSSTAASSSAGNTKNPRLGTLHFDFVTENFSPTSSATGSKALLMLCLPHHATRVPSATLLTGKKFSLVYNSIKGPLTPVLGSSWYYDEVLPSFGFDGDSGSNSMKSFRSAAVRARILASLNEDIKIALPTTSENVYGFGKQSARLAQLVHIADVLQKEVTASLSSANSNTTSSEMKQLEAIKDEASQALWSSLEHFLTSQVSDPLLYDENLGGLVTSDGVYDTGADFGNGRYNDHHFHYGYLLYACAVLGSLNRTFVDRFGSYVDGIFYDVAHSGNMRSDGIVEGAFFPGVRHKSWFDGHSFASGLFPFADGKSQESSSEAVNCYYGAYLWSLVRHSAGLDPGLDTSPQTDFSRLLLATEIRGARTYWHMQPLSNGSSAVSEDTPMQVYSTQFSKNYMVGNLGMTSAVCSTWFGTDPLYVHMINFLPVTAVTGELFRRPYVAAEINHSLRPPSQVEMAWRGFVVADTAIVDPNKAWEDATELVSANLDAGISKSQVLYWTATRYGFNTSRVDISNATTSATLPSNTEKVSKSSCELNNGCASTGLKGDCCPTAAGSFLDCCHSS